MFRNRSNVVLGIVAAAVTVSAAQGAWYAKFDGVDGSCASTSNNLIQTTVGGRSVVQWLIPEGTGEIAFRPSPENDDLPLESISFNYSRASAAVPAVGSTVGVADDVWVDGRIITAAVWARWRKGEGSSVHLEFGKSAEIDGTIQIIIKQNGAPVAQTTCTGDVVACWILTAFCPDYGCSIMCPELCGVPSTNRPDPSGGVAIDLPLGGPTTLAIPGQSPVTGDEVSVVLVPSRGDAPMPLAGARLFVGGLSALQLNTVRGEFGCPADINASGTLTVQDIFDFLTLYFSSQSAADFNNSQSLTVQDLFDFLAAYFAGCP